MTYYKSDMSSVVYPIKMDFLRRGNITMATKKDASALVHNPRGYAQALIDSKMSGKSKAVVQFEEADGEAIAELFANYDMEPPIAEVGERQIIKGTLLREGSPVETSSKGKDPVTGLDKPGSVIKTWTIQLPNSDVKFRIMSGYQLDRYMPSHIGHDIVLVKGLKVDKGRGGEQVREWLTGCASCLAAGKVG
jgi:hypothetical protein